MGGQKPGQTRSDRKVWPRAGSERSYDTDEMNKVHLLINIQHKKDKQLKSI